jgi:hypothetical protein
MSSLLFKNDIHNILPVTSTENNVKPINNIKIISNNANDDLSVTSSAFMNNLNLNTATSPINVSQMIGGDNTISVTSDLNSDINNLVNMLTSDSHMNTINNTSNQSLENKLRKLLNQDGGNFDDNMNTDELENKIYNVIKNNKQTGGANTNLVKLGLAATGAYFAYNLLNPSETESEINVNKILNNNKAQTPVTYSATSPVLSASVPVTYSATSPVLSAPVLSASVPVTYSATSPVLSASAPVTYSATSPVSSATSSVLPVSRNYVESAPQRVSNDVQKNNIKVATPQVTLKKQNDSETPVSENVFIKQSNQRNVIPQILTTTDVPISSTSSFMPVDSRVKELEMYGGNNPALVAFRSIVKNITIKLDIKYNKALKVASKLQADVKSKNPNISHEDLADAAKKLLEQKMSEYKDFAKTL